MGTRPSHVLPSLFRSGAICKRDDDTRGPDNIITGDFSTETGLGRDEPLVGKYPVILRSEMKTRLVAKVGVQVQMVVQGVQLVVLATATGFYLP